MKKKLLLVVSMVAILVCLLAFSVSAADITKYDDFGTRTTVQVSDNDLVVFDDGFTCPSAYITKDQKLLSLTFDYVNEKTGKTYAVANIVELDIPEGITEIYQYQFTKNTTMKKCSIPATVTKMQQCVFQQATGLEELVFEHTEQSALTEFPNWTVWGCTSLKAFSMPDCITTMSGVAQFNGCTNLTALYLSKNLESINSGAGNTASFGFCTNMYFVNNPFTYDSIPDKPTIYYFPENLTSLPSGGEVFKNCTNLNDVLVFPEGVTEIANGWAFNGSNAISIVFLGDMVNVSTTGNAWNNKITLYFCNENDKSAADLIGLGANTTKVYCNAEGNTTHLTEKTVDVKASCDVNAGKATYCFCGYVISKEEIAGTALSHDYDYVNSKATLVSISYTSYAASGTKIITCANCGKDGQFDAVAIFICLGASAPETGKAGIALGFTVDRDALAEYISISGKSLEFGVFAVSQENLGTNSVLDSNGNAANRVVKVDLTQYVIKSFDMKIVGFETEEQKSKQIAMGAYVIVSDGETKEISYIQDDSLTKDGDYYFVSYYDVNKTEVPAEQA